jgi:hypothetical protein
MKAPALTPALSQREREKNQRIAARARLPQHGSLTLRSKLGQSSALACGQ